MPAWWVRSLLRYTVRAGSGLLGGSIRAVLTSWGLTGQGKRSIVLPHMSTKNKRGKCVRCGKKERLRDRGFIRKPTRFLCSACVDVEYGAAADDFFSVIDEMLDI